MADRIDLKLLVGELDGVLADVAHGKALANFDATCVETLQHVRAALAGDPHGYTQTGQGRRMRNDQIAEPESLHTESLMDQLAARDAQREPDPRFAAAHYTDGRDLTHSAAACSLCGGSGRYGDGAYDGSGRWIECPNCDHGTDEPTPAMREAHDRLRKHTADHGVLTEPSAELIGDLFKIAMHGDRGSQKVMAARIRDTLISHGVTPCCPPGEPHAFLCPNGVDSVDGRKG